MKTVKKDSKSLETIDFEKTWTVENALYILQHPTVDSKIWAEAVEWLMIHGPEPIRNLLLTASGHATSTCFPDLQAQGYTEDGMPCYEVGKLAESLEITMNEAQEILARKEKEHGIRHGFQKDETFKVQ